jgi:hypothetical protein
MIGKLQLEPVTQPGAHGGQRDFQFARGVKKIGYELVQHEFGRLRTLWLRVADVNTAAVTKLHPTLAFELAVTAAHRVGMQVKTPREFARAGQALAGAQIVTDNPQNNLSDQLLAQSYAAIACEPELHGIGILVLTAREDNDYAATVKLLKNISVTPILRSGARVSRKLFAAKLYAPASVGSFAESQPLMPADITFTLV